MASIPIPGSRNEQILTDYIANYAADRLYMKNDFSGIDTLSIDVEHDVSSACCRIRVKLFTKKDYHCMIFSVDDRYFQ
jgi:hypothetical protein